jgi:hypothetical protein
MNLRFLRILKLSGKALIKPFFMSILRLDRRLLRMLAKQTRKFSAVHIVLIVTIVLAAIIAVLWYLGAQQREIVTDVFLVSAGMAA